MHGCGGGRGGPKGTISQCVCMVVGGEGTISQCVCMMEGVVGGEGTISQCVCMMEGVVGGEGTISQCVHGSGVGGGGGAQRHNFTYSEIQLQQIFSQ